jgi:predicted phage-related endonuclease
VILYDEFEQGSAEWLKTRAGKATASRFRDILATLKSGGEAAGRKNYRAELVLETITGEATETFQSAAMQWGRETEDLARTAYMLATGNDVQTVGFAKHDSILAGASPDGLVGNAGGIEIKCKIPANHIESLKLGRMPNDHMAQVQGNLWIFEREWWDYVSFDPRFPENAQLLIDRIYRDEEYINNLGRHVELFLDEVADDVAFVQSYRRAA